MKKVITTTMMLVSLIFVAQAQNTSKHSIVKKNNTHEQKVDSILARVDTLLQIHSVWLEQIELDLSLKERFKLYPTDNIYTFLQLDTKTGAIMQVQWALDSSNEFSVKINDEDLCTGYGHGSGSFELYPTKNMYQFILIDKTDGRKWHVQWGMEDNKRWIRKI
jgi:hypothetical protein